MNVNTTFELQIVFLLFLFLFLRGEGREVYAVMFDLRMITQCHISFFFFLLIVIHFGLLWVK